MGNRFICMPKKDIRETGKNGIGSRRRMEESKSHYWKRLLHRQALSMAIQQHPDCLKRFDGSMSRRIGSTSSRRRNDLWRQLQFQTGSQYSLLNAGGACVSYALEHFPTKIAKAVFLCATMISDGQRPFDVFAEEKAPVLVMMSCLYDMLVLLYGVVEVVNFSREQYTYVGGT
ncbi:hypothetical protein HAX54_012142 [Datura stramonium]|uniref:Uncharacterized protein n=1 Tax=Datura stramonium TaxID=4076 RepID=A0ABS8RXD6_DATST|nr:hypothetical protein [Datura stramonium]